MTIVLHHHHHPFANRGGSWGFDSSRASFELTVKHRLGAVAVKGSCRAGYGLLEVDRLSEIAIQFALEPARASRSGADSMSCRRRPACRALRVDASRPRPLAPERLSMRWRLGLGSHSAPLEFEARLRAAEAGSLELEATLVADHRRLGVTGFRSLL